MKVGDKVKVKTHPDSDMRGKTGIVTRIELNSRYPIRVLLNDSCEGEDLFEEHELDILDVYIEHVCKLICNCNPREAMLI